MAGCWDGLKTAAYGERNWRGSDDRDTTPLAPQILALLAAFQVPTESAPTSATLVATSRRASLPPTTLFSLVLALDSGIFTTLPLPL